ncbi:MAG: hypothetical protein ABSA18_05960 [Dehalococcoidia bacterium]
MLKHWWILVWGLALVIVISCLILRDIFQIDIYQLLYILNNPMNLMAGQYLTVLGMITAVTIAIVSWIYNQGINNRQKGFSDLRDAIAGLKTMALEMGLSFKQVQRPYQDILREWCAETPMFIKTLCEITPRWEGWQKSQPLQNMLSYYAEQGKNVMLRDPTIFTSYPVWNKICADFETYLRNVVIGLYWLSIGAMSTKSSSQLFEYLTSIMVLLVMSIILNVIAPLFSANGMYEWSLPVLVIFTFLLISHIIWLGMILFFWWRNQRKQERIWESTL